MYDTTIIDELMIKGPLWRLYKFYCRNWMDIQIWWPTNWGVKNRLVFSSLGFNSLAVKCPEFRREVSFGTYRYPRSKHQRDTLFLIPGAQRIFCLDYPLVPILYLGHGNASSSEIMNRRQVQHCRTAKPLNLNRFGIVFSEFFWIKGSEGWSYIRKYNIRYIPFF